MSKDDAKGVARPRQPENASSSNIDGAFPTHGEFPAYWWAEKFRCEEETISKGVVRLGIPYKLYFGRVKWVEAEDMRAAFPKIVPGSTR